MAAAPHAGGAPKRKAAGDDKKEEALRFCKMACTDKHPGGAAAAAAADPGNLMYLFLAPHSKVVAELHAANRDEGSNLSIPLFLSTPLQKTLLICSPWHLAYFS